MKIFAKEELSIIKRIVYPLLVIFLINTIFYTTLYGKEEKDSLKRPLELSLLFPGLGQIKEKKYLKGILFLSGELFLLASAISNNRLGNENYSRYRNADTKTDVIRFRLAVEKFDKRRNIFLFSGITIWALNMLDIYFHIKKKFKISILIKNDKDKNFTIGLNYSF